MSVSNRPRPTVSGSGSATVRQRPSVLLMLIRLRTCEATLELGLARLKERREATERWLGRLGAARVDCGEPHFDDQANTDPVAKMRALAGRAGRAARKKPPGSDDRPDRGVNAVVTGAWDIAALSPEEVLVLVDRLRFEAAGDAGAGESPDEPPPWEAQDDPVQQQIQQMVLAQLQPAAGPDRGPQFLFVSRLGDEEREAAVAEAFARARRNAERAALAAGRRFGDPASLHVTAGHAAEIRPDRLLDRQRCAALLAGSTYELGEYESASDDPRPGEFTVTVNAGFALE
jgi:hypothetical protein